MEQRSWDLHLVQPGESNSSREIPCHEAPQMNIPASLRYWLRRVGELRSDAQLATSLRSFSRLARLGRIPAGCGPIAVSLKVDGRVFEVFVRPRSSDAIVVNETFLGRYHLPPIPLRSVRTILDLGANIGLTMAHLAVLCPDARIVGLELDRDNVSLARRNVARWNDRCEVIEGAAWIRDEPTRYRLARGAECGAALADDGAFQVQGVQLGTLLARIGWNTVDYVKMDVEGAEQALLRESTDWARQVRSIKIELHGGYRLNDCVSDLERLGFAARVDPRHPAAVSGVRVG
jgi:FkbM family methyltransferase